MAEEGVGSSKVISAKRCLNHALREAVVRCPSCSQFYCRECVVEHDGKMSCQSCLSLADLEETKESSGLGKKAVSFLGLVASVSAIWIFFYMVGSWLRSLPEEYHENPAEYLDWVGEDE